jgi:hypothetical protein
LPLRAARLRLGLHACGLVWLNRSRGRYTARPKEDAALIEKQR